MLIDKTTGIGCARSILSKPVTKKLIAEGIMGKIISRKCCQSSCTYFRVIEFGGPYVTSEKDDKFAAEPLWTPSFIDVEIWNQAVDEFQRHRGLEVNVANYLLPKMDEYIQSISDAELLSITKYFLLEQGVLNKPISQHAGKTYYFNENEIYSLDAVSDSFPYDKRIKMYMFDVKFETCFNMNVWHKAVSRFEVGMTLDECVEYFLKTELAHRIPQQLSPVDRLVQYISPPMYERVPENKNKSTFDRIRVAVGLPRYRFDSWKALRNEVKKYQHEICQRVIPKIEKDRQFKKYGVPINFLKLSSVTLLRDFSLELIFELKTQEIDPLPDMQD